MLPACADVKPNPQQRIVSRFLSCSLQLCRDLAGKADDEAFLKGESKNHLVSLKRFYPIWLWTPSCVCTTTFFHVIITRGSCTTCTSTLLWSQLWRRITLKATRCETTYKQPGPYVFFNTRALKHKLNIVTR